MSVEAPAPPKRKRGTESVRDMLLSLAAVFALVIPFWYLTSLDDSDVTSQIRVVDTAPSIESLQEAVPGVPAPGDLPEQWRPTSANVEGPSLRIGYITPDDAYAEYYAQGGSLAAQDQFLAEQTGEGTPGAELTVGDQVFEVWSNDEGATSLVLQDAGGAWTVVVGGLREDAGDEQLQVLAASLR